MSERFDMVAKTFLGLEGVLADELRALGAQDVSEGNRVVMFTGDLETMYRANFACRTAVRILKPFLKLRSSSADDLYEQVREFEWEQLMTVSTTFAIDVTAYSEQFNNSRFVTYRVKDAIVDYFNNKYGKRPSIRVANPEIRIDVHISGTEVTLSLDSSGDPLFKRGWRVAQTDAPINEVLAAGMILLSGWKGDCDLVDPMCGSGTFLVEAALIGANIAPGICGRDYAFQQWKDYDPDLFDKIYNDDSHEREFTHKIYGSDIEGKAIAIARANVKNAGVGRYVELERRGIEDIEQAPSAGGVIITNPPYGERLNPEGIEELYHTLGSKLKHVFQGYTAWIISYDKELTYHIGLKPSLRYPLNNGGLDCELLEYVMFDGTYDELRSRGEHIRNENFRASEHSKFYNDRPEMRPEGSERRDYDRPPRRQFDGPQRERRDFDRPQRRQYDDQRQERRDYDRPRRQYDGPQRERRDFDRPPRRQFDDQRRDYDRPQRRQFDDQRRDYDRPPRRQFDGDRHSESFARNMLQDRGPRLGSDKEVPIIHGRRKSWKRRDLDEPDMGWQGNAPTDDGDNNQ